MSSNIVLNNLNYKKSKNDIILAAVFLIISPLLSLPFIINLINKEVKGATYLMAVFMAIFAFLFPPMGDLYKHNMIYYSWGTGDFLLWLDMNSKTDYVIWGMSYIFSSLNIKFEYIRLIITLIEFLIFSWIYEKYVLNKPLSHKIKMRAYWLMCIGFIPLYQILGMRHGLAIVLFLYAILNLYEENRLKYSLVYFVLSAVVHFHFAPLAILAIVNNFYPLVRSKKIFFILLFVGMVSGAVLTPILMRFVFGDFSKSEGYMDPDNEYGGGMTFSGNAGIGMLLDRLWYIPILLVFITKKHTENVKMEGLLYIFAIMVFFFWSFHTFSERTGKVLGCLLCVYYALYPITMKRVGKIYALTMFVLVFMQLYGLRLLMFYTDNNLSDIWQPMPLCLQDEYTINWLNKNVDSDGGLISVGEHWSL